MLNKEIILRKEIVRIGKLLYDKNLIVATDGNISVRFNKGTILITPSGYCKGLLKPNEIVRIAFEKNPVFRLKINPSSEFQMHLAIYKKRFDIYSIIHAHPVYLTNLASLNYKIKNLVKRYFLKLPELSQMVGQISWIGKFLPGSTELAQAVAQKIVKSNIVILANHGIVAVGEELKHALYQIERMEFAAKLFTLNKINY